MADSSLRIVVAGLIAQHPTLGGMTWHHLQYLAGLVRLGHDVYYLEDSGQWPYTLDGGPSGNEWIARDCSANLHHLSSALARYGLQDRWAYRFPTESRWFGLSERERDTLIDSADILLNVSGSLEHPLHYRRIPRLVYVDTDPVFTQVKILLGQADFAGRIDAHDVHFSYGERLGAVGPSTCHRWRPTRQPIVLTEWHPEAPHGETFSTVMNWTSYEPLRYAGQVYGQKDVELSRFLELPLRMPTATFEVACSRTEHVEWQTAPAELPMAVRALMSGGDHWAPDDLLRRTGWRIIDSTEACGTPEAYRQYIQSSKAEWSVAKNGYVVGQPGWFSDRSACYLAAGRPVVVQDTGFGAVLPVGEGLVPFRTLDEAVAGVAAVQADYGRHARAARMIAEEYFDSDLVLARLVDEAMSSLPARPTDRSTSESR